MDDPITLPEPAAKQLRSITESIQELKQERQVYLQGLADAMQIDLSRYEINIQDGELVPLEGTDEQSTKAASTPES